MIGDIALKTLIQYMHGKWRSGHFFSLHTVSRKWTFICMPTYMFFCDVSFSYFNIVFNHQKHADTDFNFLYHSTMFLSICAIVTAFFFVWRENNFISSDYWNSFRFLKFKIWTGRKTLPHRIALVNCEYCHQLFMKTPSTVDEHFTAPVF